MTYDQSIPRLNTAMAAFVDILGFKERVCAVDSDEALMKLYADVRTVHRIFDKDSVDELTRSANEQTSKKVIALSDALVITIDFDSPLSRIDGVFDILASNISEIALNQGLAVAQGVFHRGGLALGYHFRDNQGDILLSSAMSKAYTAEKLPFYPLIAMEQQFYEYFTTHPGNNCYADPIAPKNQFFISVINPETGDQCNCLDYLHLSMEWLQSWDRKEDLIAYKAEKNPEQKAKILDDSYRRNEQRFLSNHKKSIQIELVKPYPKRTQEKYLWLRDYHNDFIERCHYDQELRID